MLLLRQALGALLIIYIPCFLPLGCKAAFDSEKISMKYLEESRDSYYLKPSRKLLNEEKSHVIQMSYTSVPNDNPWFFICVFLIVIVVFLLLVRCCIKLARTEDYENQRMTVHPPPRIQQYSQSYASSRPLTRSYASSRPLTQSYASSRTITRSYGSSRPIAPPRTSSRLILLPEPGIDENAYFGLENPNVNLFTIYHDTSDQIDHQPSIPIANNPEQSIILPNAPSPSNSPTQLPDQPPDYNSVFTTNQQNDNSSRYAINTSNNLANSENMPPPKYEDLH